MSKINKIQVNSITYDIEDTSKYEKPSGGIPSTDLSSAVQTSLGKADTALQSETYTGTITSVKMNGSTVSSSGEADLGTVITQHQDISGKQDIIQYSTMPTASSETVGKIVQYIGTTTVEAPIYTNGYFYIGTTDGEATPTYSWTQINVQPGSSGNYEETSNKVTSVSSSSTDTQYPSAKCLYDNIKNSAVVGYADNTNNNTILLKTANPGVYAVPNQAFFYENQATASGAYMLVVYKKFSEVSNNTIFAYGLSIIQNWSKIMQIFTVKKVSTGNQIQIDYTNLGQLVGEYPQTFNGVKTFSSIPKVSSYTAPTTDTELTAKKYVDDLPTTYSGYDATKTQVLKNVNGTLTWIDE